MPYFGQEIMLHGGEERAADRREVHGASWRRTIGCRATLGIDAVMAKYKLDALVAPTGGPAWLIDLVNGDGGTANARGRRPSRRSPAIRTSRCRPGIVRGLPVGHFVLRPRVERADADQARVRVRAGDEAPQAADVCRDGRR